MVFFLFTRGIPIRYGGRTAAPAAAVAAVAGAECQGAAIRPHSAAGAVDEGLLALRPGAEPGRVGDAAAPLAGRGRLPAEADARRHLPDIPAWRAQRAGRDGAHREAVGRHELGAGPPRAAGRAPVGPVLGRVRQPPPQCPQGLPGEVMEASARTVRGLRHRHRAYPQFASRQVPCQRLDHEWRGARALPPLSAESAETFLDALPAEGDMRNRAEELLAMAPGAPRAPELAHP